jgi:hypothetical protein
MNSHRKIEVRNNNYIQQWKFLLLELVIKQFLKFCGTLVQIIGGTGGFTGSNAFNHLL